MRLVIGFSGYNGTSLAQSFLLRKLEKVSSQMRRWVEREWRFLKVAKREFFFNELWLFMWIVNSPILAMVLVLNPRGRRANAWIFWPQLKTEYPEISDYICFKHKLPQITFPYTEMCADVLLSGSWVLIMLILMGFWSSDTYLCIAFVTILHKRVPVWYPGQGAVSRHMK